MAISIDRRNAFASAFNRYPDVLNVFARDNCKIVDPRTAETKIGGIDAISRICMAQFAVRLVKTRAKNAGPALAWFGFETVNRYIQYKKSLIGELEIIADEKYRRALHNFEQGMVAVIFAALAEEANIDPENFVEKDFWHDVFLALAQNQSRAHPLWINPLQTVILDHLWEFQTALESVEPLISGTG
jgi:hypothetical protein